MIDEEKVKWPSKKKYPCKRNKGEHEYLKPTIKFGPDVDYFYDNVSGGILLTDTPEQGPEYKLAKTEVSIVLETVCKHCGHKCLSFLREKIK